jgi:hypothetical protein
VNPVWWQKYDKSKKFLASLQEDEEFVLYGRNRFCMIAGHVTILFCTGMMLKMLLDSFTKIVAEHPHYKPVVDEITATMGKISGILKAIDVADKQNEVVPDEDHKEPASA